MIIMTLIQVDITVEEEESIRQRLAVESEVVDQRTGLDKRLIFIHILHNLHILHILHIINILNFLHILHVCRVAEVAREHGWHPPKSLDSDENFKPEYTLFCRKLRFVAIYALFGVFLAK